MHILYFYVLFPYINNLLNHILLLTVFCYSLFFAGMFFFSCIWSIGAVCDSETKKKFNLIFLELLKGDLSDELKKSLQLGACDVPPLETPYVFPLPKEHDIFSYKVHFTIDMFCLYILFYQKVFILHLILDFSSLIC